MLQQGWGAGLADFVYRDPAVHPGVPARQSVLSMGLDQASTNWSGMFFLQYACGLAIHMYPDFSHGMDNDVCGAAKDVSLWPVILMTTIVMNMPWGPWGGQAFWGKLQGAWMEYCSHAPNSSDELFQSFLPLLARDLNETDLGADDTLAQTIWSNLVSGAEMQKKGQKVSLTRFFGWHKCFPELDAKWHTWALFLVYLGLKEGWFKEPLKVPQVASTGSGSSGSAQGPGMKPGTSRGPPSELSRMTAACRNRMHFSAVVLLDPMVQTKARLLAAFAAPLMLNHGVDNRDARSADDLAKVGALYAAGSGLAPLNTLFSHLGDPSVLDRLGLQAHFSPAQRKKLRRDSPETHAQDEIAALAFRYSVALVRRRLKRMAFALWGWPSHLAVLTLKEPAVTQKCLGDLKVAWEAWLACEQKPGGQWMVNLKKRSVFHQPINKMAVNLAATGGFQEVSQELLDLATTIARSLRTQVVEDGFCNARDHETRVSKSGGSRCPAIWSKLMADEVLSRKHNFSEVGRAKLGSSRVAGSPLSPMRDGHMSCRTARWTLSPAWARSPAPRP